MSRIPIPSSGTPFRGGFKPSRTSQSKSSVLNLAFDFLLSAKAQLAPGTFDLLIAEFMDYEETLIPGVETFQDISPVLVYIVTDILKGHPQLQNTFAQYFLRPVQRDVLDAICAAVHLVQLVGRVEMIAGDEKYKAVLKSIRACWSGKIDMATHVKQLHGLFLPEYPNILVEFNEFLPNDKKWKQPPTLSIFEFPKKEVNPTEQLWRTVPSNYEKYKPWRPDIGNVTRVKQALGEIGEVESVKIVEGKSKNKK